MHNKLNSSLLHMECSNSSNRLNHISSSSSNSRCKVIFLLFLLLKVNNRQEGMFNSSSILLLNLNLLASLLRNNTNLKEGVNHKHTQSMLAISNPSRYLLRDNTFRRAI